MIPVQITIRDLPGSQALEENIHKKAEKLTQFYQQILSCRVVIESPQKHKHQGKLYSVRLELDVPGKELVVDNNENEDVYIGVRDAFNALKRQLSDYAHKRRGDVKNHPNSIQEKSDTTLHDPLIH